jgi:hypothetical protein
MNHIPKLLSKTKLLRGYRCAKYIYLTIHHPELEAPITPELQALFDQGNWVGIEARKRFPGGVLIDNKPWDFVGALTRTREAIAAGVQTIYEAAFEYMGCYARADIIQFSPISKRWRIYEVKSTTKLKPEHIDDTSIQTWIMAKAGLPIEQVNVLHLNPNCHYPDLSHLFLEHDVTEDMRTQYPHVQPKIYELWQIIKSQNIPETNLGPHCLAPTECSFIEYCWKEKAIPQNSIFNLPRLGERKWDLYQVGVINLDDERLTDLNPLQERIVQAHKTGKNYVDVLGIQATLAQWQFPLIFLDFETINPAIPRYTGCTPYQHTPFQFSVHIWSDPHSALQHYEFLHETNSDPRPTLIPALLEACGTKGSIVAYYSNFEISRIQELADYAPEYKDNLNSLIARMVDPLPLLREYVYFDSFEGSFSLKKVAAALLGDSHSYEGMLVANGNDAQRAFEELISENISAEKKKVLRKAMLEYCCKDTLEMVEIVKWLFQQNNPLSSG